MTVAPTGSAPPRTSHEPLVPGGLSIPALQEDTPRAAATLDRDLARRLWPFLRPHLRWLTTALVAMPAAAAASLLQPLLLKRAIDVTLVEKSVSALSVVVVAFAGTVLLETVLRFVQTYAMQLAGQRAMAGLRRAVFAHIQKLPIAYFDRTPSGRIVTRATNDVDGLSELFASGAVTAIADVVTLVGIVAFMLALDWQLSLVTFVALPPLAILVDQFRRRARVAFRDIRARIAQLNAYLAEQVQGIAVVQALAREALCAAEYRAINDAYRRANLRSIRYDALLYSVVEAVATATVAMLLWYASVRAGWLPEEGSKLWVGTVVAFYEYIQRFFVPVRDLSTKFTVIQSSLASAERIFGLLDEPLAAGTTVGDGPEGPAAGQTGEDPDPDVAVRFEHVSFAYVEGHPVLRDVDFAVRRGETVALVGATGAGKTTVTSLLLRLYEVEAGRVLLGGRDVRSEPPSALRRRFAVVPQDVFLFAGTVLENIALEDDPDRGRAAAALEQVGAMGHLADRGGVDARVEERGANFSAGERQLLAFARALYRDPEVLVLDEATANVDSETEAELQRAVLELTRDRTSLVIAHRLSTVRHADRILVFHHGSLVEQGPHDALVERGGVYARLVALQFAEG